MTKVHKDKILTKLRTAGSLRSAANKLERVQCNINAIGFLKQPPFPEIIQRGSLIIDGPNYKKDFITSPSE